MSIVDVAPPVAMPYADRESLVALTYRMQTMHRAPRTLVLLPQYWGEFSAGGWDGEVVVRKYPLDRPDEFGAASLFVYGSARSRMFLLFIIPFLINGVVTTISRSGFLAMGVGGLVFNLFTPRRFSGRVRLFSVLALLLFVMLTNPIYWERIQSIKYKGEDVEGIDTGAGRLDIMHAQWRMFRDHPWGCGHFCTEILSPSFLPPENVNVETGRGASHNTFLGLTVDQGAPGAVAYVALLLWVIIALRRLAIQCRESSGFLATLLPAVAAFFAAMTVADMFVPYVRYEIRFWFVGVLLVMLILTARERAEWSPAAMAVAEVAVSERSNSMRDMTWPNPSNR
ncbi:MAG TPA: O-antigen ligase family protein [Blastocatellia bacterium]|nr:O-antigen ligase family protein [Blastocatellia bacterium]